MISVLLEFLKTTLFIAVVLQGSFYRTFCVGKIMLSLSLSIAQSELPRRYDLIRVVNIHATVMASGSLMHILDFWHTTSRTALIKRIDVDN